MGVLSDLTIYAPSSAEEGAVVDVGAFVRSLVSYETISIAFLNTVWNSEYLGLGGGWIDPGTQRDFWATFTMPAHDVTVHVEVWVWDATLEEWVYDGEEETVVSLSGPPPPPPPPLPEPEFSDFAVGEYNRV